MQKKLPELSIFFPFWNEEKNIETVIKKAMPIAEKIADNWEIIMIDDGSSDKTLSIAKKLVEKNKNLRIISHLPNRGYGAALKEGFNKSKFKYIIFNDGDNQFDFLEVDKFIEFIGTADLVIGYRKKRNDVNLLKRLLLMNMLKAWDFILFHFYFRDIDCGFKMFTREALDKIGPLRSEGAMITTEILAKAKRKKLKIKEVGVTHYPRLQGAQSGANFPVIVRAVLESLQLWYDLHYGRA
ncbi:glycosyltransferase family 2 protein [Patescibacteria group bacterium]|nr:glycosyltransferase family 2 protein [Patescibacteria group bacterium]